jgi:hypothetical protein
MKFRLLDWRTVRVCAPEEARQLRVALLALPLVVVVAMLAGATLGTTSVPVLLGLYLAFVIGLGLRTQATARMIVARLEHQDNDSGPHVLGADLAERLSGRIERARVAFEESTPRNRYIFWIAFGVSTAVVIGLAVVIAGAFGSKSSARPPAASIEISVPGTASPTSRTGDGMVGTGITLKPGTSVTISADGTITCVATGVRCVVGPEGDPAAPTSGEGFPISGAPAWGLIARVGDAPAQFIGKSGRLIGNGEIKLGVNDNFPEDNSGAFHVTLNVPCTDAGSTGGAACGVSK